jgi:uncharacterized protein
MSLNCPYLDIRVLPKVLPVFPLSRALLLPRSELPLTIFEPRYIAMVDAAIAGERLIGLIQPRSPEYEKTPSLFPVGCAGKITSFAETGDARYLITLTGVCRFRILEEQSGPTAYRNCRVNYDEFSADLETGAGVAAVDRDRIIDTLKEFALSSKLEVDWASIDAAPTETLVNALAMMSPFGALEKQSLLEAKDLKARAEMLIALAEMDITQHSDEPRQYH